MHVSESQLIVMVTKAIVCLLSSSSDDNNKTKTTTSSPSIAFFFFNEQGSVLSIESILAFLMLMTILWGYVLLLHPSYRKCNQGAKNLKLL